LAERDPPETASGERKLAFRPPENRPGGLSQLFSPAADTIARIVLLSVLAAPFVFMGGAWAVMRSAYVTGQSITLDQSALFSHAHHVGDVDLDCRYCHTAVEHAAFAGIPPTMTCTTCHSQLFTNAPILAPVRESLAEGKPLRWTRVHRLPDYVYFDLLPDMGGRHPVAAGGP
jgi:hypothetical protein